MKSEMRRYSAMRVNLNMNEKSISPVIGMVLMMLIIVFVSTIVILKISEISRINKINVPITMLKISPSQHGIIVQHTGGDAINYKEIAFILESNDERMKISIDDVIINDSNFNGLFDPNEEIIIPSSLLKYHFYEIFVIYIPSSLVIHKAKIMLPITQTSTPTPIVFEDTFDNGPKSGWQYEYKFCSGWKFMNGYAESTANAVGAKAVIYRTITLNSDGWIEFDWLCTGSSSWFEFYVDGKLKAWCPKNGKWHHVKIPLTAGTHEIKWVHEVRGMMAYNEKAWLDNVKVYQELK